MPFSGESIIFTLVKKLKYRNIDAKIVGDISKMNVNCSKRLMKYSDIKHSDGLVGCSFRNEQSYSSCHISENKLIDPGQEIESFEKLTHFFYVDNVHFVRQQEILFKPLSVPTQRNSLVIAKFLHILLVSPFSAFICATILLSAKAITPFP